MEKEVPLIIKDFESCRNLDELKEKYAEKGIYFRNEKKLYKRAKIDWWKLNKKQPSHGDELPADIVEDEEYNATYYVHKIVHEVSELPWLRMNKEVKNFVKDKIEKYIEKNSDSKLVRIFLEQGFKELFNFSDNEHIIEINDVEYVAPMLAEEISKKGMIKLAAYGYSRLILLPLEVIFYSVFSHFNESIKIKSQITKNLIKGLRDKNAFYDAINDVKAISLPEPLERDYNEKYNRLAAIICNYRSEYMARFVKNYVCNLDKDIEKEMHIVVGAGHNVDYYLKTVQI